MDPSYHLDGKNYLQWSQLVKIFLKGCGKLNHLIAPGLSPSDPRFFTWDEADSMIMSWLWSSMQPELNACFSHLLKKYGTLFDRHIPKSKTQPSFMNSKTKSLTPNKVLFLSLNIIIL